MPGQELDPNDPSVVFGQNQGLFAYNMARSLTAHTDTPVAERAGDAVNTATRMFDEPDINIKVATSGLIAALESESGF